MGHGGKQISEQLLTRTNGFLQPFKKAMQSKFPGQRVMFASWQKSKDIMDLNKTLVSMYLFFL